MSGVLAMRHHAKRSKLESKIARFSMARLQRILQLKLQILQRAQVPAIPRRHLAATWHPGSPGGYLQAHVAC